MEKKYTDININTRDLIYPYFVVAGKRVRQRIKSFPGIYRLSIDELLKDMESLESLRLNKVLLFGIPERKDSSGASAYAEDNIVARAVRAIKERFSELTVMTDVCLCGYTTHGHCGVVRRQKSEDRSQKTKKFIDNEATIEILAKIALSHAEAGADWVAPSAMAKGQVRAIRRALDKNGFEDTKIMGYSAKFASCFYGPFRNAANSTPKFDDRSAYQLDYRNGKSALDEIEADVKEGADMVMVKPALSYLDIIKEAKLKFSHSLAAYNVSGEYAFVKYGALKRLWDEKKMVFEVITSIKRAGADYIVTYHAKDVAAWLKE